MGALMGERGLEIVLAAVFREGGGQHEHGMGKGDGERSGDLGRDEKLCGRKGEGTLTGFPELRKRGTRGQRRGVMEEAGGGDDGPEKPKEEEEGA